MKWLILTLLISLSASLPVTKTKVGNPEPNSSPTPDVETALAYERYLKEVVEALESDPEFRKKLDKAPEADLRSGKIAQELDYVNHHIRTKLDEIKRRELQRLREYANKDYELNNGIERDHQTNAQHLDHKNVHTFEIEDLRKLIKKTSEDLAQADHQRRAEFKEYEMQKEFEHQSKAKEMDEEHRKKYENDLKAQHESHKKHEKLHHPGNKAQLEEVWEKQDHMDKQEFDPHAFFMLHDIDSNGYWDETEVKALFIKELDKVYQSGIPEDDMRERAEEMERMREHVFKETDTNHDSLISFAEFMDQTKREEFNKDPEWETVDEQPQYTHEEYLQFQRQKEDEIQQMRAQGLLPPHPNMPQEYYLPNPQDSRNMQHNNVQSDPNKQHQYLNPSQDQYSQNQHPQPQQLQYQQAQPQHQLSQPQQQMQSQLRQTEVITQQQNINQPGILKGGQHFQQSQDHPNRAPH